MPLAAAGLALACAAGCARTGLGVPEPLHACVGLDPNAETRQVVSAEVALDRSDILFLVDNSSSMADEIDRIREQLISVLIPEISERVSDAQFGVAVFADFGSRRIGDMSHPYQLLQPITGDLRRVLDAARRIELEDGGDAPESQLEALYQVATGEGLGDFVPPGPECPDGGRGGVCFRPESFAVTLLFTDAPMRQVIGIGPDGRMSPVIPDPTSPDGPFLHENLIRQYDDALRALQTESIRVVGLWSGVSNGLDDLRRIVRDTGALDAQGQPIVLDIGSKGEGLGGGVVQAVELVTAGARLAVHVELEDGDEADAVDARALVTAVRAIRADPADGAASDGERFVEVRSGTRLFFELAFDPSRVPQAELEQRYPLGLRVLTEDGTLLSEEILDVVIAARDACATPAEL